MSRRTWRIDGLLALHDLSDLVGENLEAEEDISTTSGYVTHRLGGFPKVGDTLTLGQFRLRVDQMDGPKVARLTLTKLPPPEPATDI